MFAKNPQIHLKQFGPKLHMFFVYVQLFQVTDKCQYAGVCSVIVAL